MTGTLHKAICTFIIVFRSILLIMRNVSDKSCREYQNFCKFDNLFLPKSCNLCNRMEQYCTAGQTTDDNLVTAQALCMLDN
jgi:hypothetical protein